MDQSDEELVAAVQSGDERALEALLARFQPHIYRFGMRMCRNPSDAEDVLQETLLAASRSVQGFRGASSLTTWLFTIARSFCIKKRRKEAAAQRAGAADDSTLDRILGVPDASARPDDIAASRQALGVLERAIADLPPKYREVLLLRDVEGLTAPQVAEVLGAGVPAVKTRLHRARKMLRDRVIPALGDAYGPRDAGSGAGATAASAAETCPDVVTLFSRYLEEEISPDLCAQMEQHLKECAACRNVCDSLKYTLKLCAQSPTEDVPKDVQQSVHDAIQTFLKTGCQPSSP